MNDIVVIILICFAAVAAIAAAKAVYVFLNRRRHLVGFHFGNIYCPKCNEAVPQTRKPRSVRQELYGGWTCASCGTEMDKLGTDITDTDSMKSGRGGKRRRSFDTPFDNTGRSPVERLFQESESSKDK
jgi:hypothetical protein